jgi:hypothetical protein
MADAKSDRAAAEYYKPFNISQLHKTEAIRGNS